MKAENVRIQFSIWLPVCEPDAMNNTSVSVDGEILWPFPDETEITEDAFPLGSVFKLEIPSGKFKGTIEKTLTVKDSRGTHISIKARGTWQGRAGGLAGGLSGLGDFMVINNRYTDPALVTESSALDNAVVGLDTYEAVRGLAGLLTRDASKKQGIMSKLFDVVAPLNHKHLAELAEHYG